MLSFCQPSQRGGKTAKIEKMIRDHANNLRRSVKYSISQIISFVSSKDLLRYIPDSMLLEKQRAAKWEAIAETMKKTNGTSFT